MDLLSLAFGLYGSPEHADNGNRGGKVVGSETVLETEDLTKEFAGFVAVRSVNLRVARGGIHALIGPNGAGKTTVFNLLSKFLRPTRGRIVFDGRDVTALESADVARLGLVRSFQISAVFPHLTVLENVRIALQRKRGGSFDFWRSKRTLHALDDRAMTLITDVGLAPYAGVLAVELPYGRKRVLDIFSRASLQPPDPERHCQHYHQCRERYNELIHSTPPAVAVEFEGQDVGRAVPPRTVILCGATL